MLMLAIGLPEQSLLVHDLMTTSVALQLYMPEDSETLLHVFGGVSSKVQPVVQSVLVQLFRKPMPGAGGGGGGGGAGVTGGAWLHEA